MDPIVLLPGQGERITIGGSIAILKATADTTGGAFSISEATFPPGMSGPPSHAHHATVDTFYVLEGTVRFTIGEREIDASEGSYVVVPPGVMHTFANPTGEPARFLNINAPGGWEDYLRDLSDAMQSGIMPGSSDFASIVAKYDFVVPV